MSQRRQACGDARNGALTGAVEAIAFASVESDAETERLALAPRHDRLTASNRASRAVECGEDALADALRIAAAEPLRRFGDDGAQAVDIGDGRCLGRIVHGRT